MDFQKLGELLPRPPTTWSMAEVHTWLDFIGLEDFKEIFTKNYIDGSILLRLEPGDLEFELGLKMPLLVRKKILAWIDGLKIYEHKRIRKDKFNFELLVNSRQKKKGVLEQPQHKLLVLAPPDNESTLQIVRPPCKVGRHSANNFMLQEESISRFHAEITYEEDSFRLTDVGSLFGTYVRVQGKCELTSNILIEIGSFYFEFIPIETGLQVKVFRQQQEIRTAQFQFQTSRHLTIGRKASNMLNFQNDQHMSNLHAIVTKLGQNYYIQDLESTNGTWVRLSRSFTRSAPMAIGPGFQIKFGSALSFRCMESISQANNKESKKESAQQSQTAKGECCLICCQQQKNALFFPCKHNTCCVKCAKNMAVCPVCRLQIKQLLRIYKS